MRLILMRALVSSKDVLVTWNGLPSPLTGIAHKSRAACSRPWSTKSQYLLSSDQSVIVLFSAQAKAKSGLHPTTASFLDERQVAALGSDGNNDTAPSTTEGIGFPMHVLALNAMGVHLFDYLQLEDVSRHCQEVGRWEFLFVAAPLRIVGGTGSPLNPTAIF